MFHIDLLYLISQTKSCGKQTQAAVLNSTFNIDDISANIDGGWLGYYAGGPGASSWLIASASPVAVPEPSPLYLVGFGAVCGSVYVMGHKRRARRTATTAA